MRLLSCGTRADGVREEDGVARRTTADVLRRRAGGGERFEQLSEFLPVAATEDVGFAVGRDFEQVAALRGEQDVMSQFLIFKMSQIAQEPSAAECPDLTGEGIRPERFDAADRVQRDNDLPDGFFQA